MIEEVKFFLADDKHSLHNLRNGLLRKFFCQRSQYCQNKWTNCLLEFFYWGTRGFVLTWCCFNFKRGQKRTMLSSLTRSDHVNCLSTSLQCWYKIVGPWNIKPGQIRKLRKSGSQQLQANVKQVFRELYFCSLNCVKLQFNSAN